MSVVSRLSRAFELRATDVQLDATARACSCATAPAGASAWSRTSPTRATPRSTTQKINQIAADNDLPDGSDILFVEVTRDGPVGLRDRRCEVHGQVLHGRYRVLT